LERLVLFVMGGAGYMGLEVAWRGATHWTMFFAGGAAVLLLTALANGPLPLWAAAGLGAAGITGIELASGLVCQYVLRCAVWDYSAQWGNVAGLICPLYTFYWLILCVWVLFFMRWLKRSCPR